MKAWLLLVAAFLLWPGFSSQNACEEPNEIHFGEIVSAEKAKYLENDRVQYKCNPGYVLEGPEWIQCKGQEWTLPPPKCLAPCSITRQQLAAKNLFVFGNQRKARLIQSNQSLQFQCNEGYVLVVPPVRKCVDGYMDLPLCISERGKNCSGPPRTENGDITTLSEKQYRSGSSVEFRCQKYYAMEGQNRSICNNGTWTKVPICLDPCMIPRTELESQKIEVKDEIDASENIFVQHGHSIELSCRTGYVLAENSSRSAFVIQCDGTTPVIPKCKDVGSYQFGPVLPKTCLKPPEDDFTFNTTKTIFLSGDELHYECNEGFETIKDTIGDIVVCKEKGWEPTPGCQSIVCNTPFLENGRIDPREDIFHHKMVVQFKCDKGFTRVGSESAQCYHFGWSPQPPICKENVKPCPAPPIILHGTVTGEPKALFQHGDLLEVQCEISFALYGSKIIECVDGEWAPLPSCIEEVKTCGQPPTIRNGFFINVESSIYRHGDTMEYRCLRPSAVIGTNPAKCLHGKWEVPSCLINPRSCTRPLYAVFQPTVQTTKLFKTNQLASYRCGSNLHQTICVNGLWLPEPRCKGTCPPPPQLPNAINVAEMRIYRNGEEISFKCQVHFLLRGPQKIKCEAGKWKTPPHCLDLRCKSPPQIDNGVVEIGNRAIFFPGEIVEYRCSSGFEISQSNTVTCENGKWSEPPLCKDLSK